MNAGSLPAQLLWLVAALALVLGAIHFGLRRLLSWSGAARLRSPAPMRVVQRLVLGRQQSLVMLEIEGRRLVIGVTDHHVNPILGPIEPGDFAGKERPE